MKKFVTLLLIFGCAIMSRAQTADAAAPHLTADELQRLLAPIAIYPDSLIAIILPASTVPSDIVLASRYLTSNGDVSQIANQGLDDSVVALSRYPEVLKWMDQNLQWTRQLGEAFATQPADVMNAIQALRRRAQQAGLLQSTPQEQIVEDDGNIEIDPTSPDVLYVPEYDPDVIYYGRPVGGPWLSFSVGFAAGPWLNHGFDWRRHEVIIHRGGPDWHYTPGWTRRDHTAQVQTWRPPANNWQRTRHVEPGHSVPHVERAHYTSPSTAPHGEHVEPRRGDEHADPHRADDHGHTSNFTVPRVRTVVATQPSPGGPVTTVAALPAPRGERVGTWAPTETVSTAARVEGTPAVRAPVAAVAPPARVAPPPAVRAAPPAPAPRSQSNAQDQRR